MLVGARSTSVAAAPADLGISRSGGATVFAGESRRSVKPGEPTSELASAVAIRLSRGVEQTDHELQVKSRSRRSSAHVPAAYGEPSIMMDEAAEQVHL